MLGSEADVWELKPEDWMANLAIAGVVDEEARKEFMKIENPNMTKIRKGGKQQQGTNRHLQGVPGEKPKQ